MERKGREGNEESESALVSRSRSWRNSGFPSVQGWAGNAWSSTRVPNKQREIRSLCLMIVLDGKERKKERKVSSVLSG